MTKEELNRRRMMFQINAKRNELLKPENISVSTVRHSATNDFLAFRKKVAAGMKKQKEQNVEVFNVTAANLQNYQDMLDNNELIHAGMNNQYIAKLDDFYGKGKPRYFYDQTEWDNYRKNMQSAGQAAADRGAKEGADAKNKALASKAQEAFTNSNRNSTLNTAQSRREEAVNKSQKDLYNKALASEALKGKNGAVVNRMTSLEKAQSGREAAINNSESSVKPSDNENSKTPEIVQEAQSGRENAIKRSDPKYQKELEKAKSIKSDKDRWGAYSESDLEEISKDKRFSNIKNEDDAVNYPGGVEKLYNDIEAALEEKYPGKKKNYEAAKNAGADRATKEKENAEKEKEDSQLYQLKKDIVKDAKKPGATVKDLADKYELPEAYVNYIVYDETGKNIPEDKNDLGTHREINALRNKRSKEGAIERSKKRAKHSSLEDGITTDAMTPDQEYIAFRKKVEAGIKHFGTTRGLMSIPKNQALADGDSMSHAGMTNKYYAKLDDFWGKGKPRYFYSKEEWDGYQRNKQGAAQAGAQRGAKEGARVAGEIAARKEKAIKDAQSYKEVTSKTSEDTKNHFKNIDNTALAEKANTAYNKAWTDSKRNKFLNDAQGGREAAIKNSGSFVKSSDDGNTKVTVTIEKTPEIVQKAQSGREAAEKGATKRTMTTMAYNKAVKDYDEVAKEIDKEYGFDKLDPTDSKAVNKTWQKLIKDTAKVIDSGKVDNPNNVKYEYQLKDDDANSYAWAAYIQEYASESLRLNSIYNDLQNEYAKTLQTAQAMHDFDAIAESNKHASELFDQMQKVQEQMKENAKENDAKVLPYLAAIYKELL